MVLSVEKQKQHCQVKHDQSHGKLIELTKCHGFRGNPAIGLNQRPGAEQENDDCERAEDERVQLRRREAAAGAGAPAIKLCTVPRHAGACARYCPVTEDDGDAGCAREGSR